MKKNFLEALVLRSPSDRDLHTIATENFDIKFRATSKYLHVERLSCNYIEDEEQTFVNAIAMDNKPNSIDYWVRGWHLHKLQRINLQ